MCESCEKRKDENHMGIQRLVLRLSSNGASSAYRLLDCFFVIYKQDCICHGITERKLLVLKTVNIIFAQLQLKTAMIFIKKFGALVK